MLKHLVILLILVTIVPTTAANADSKKELCEKNDGDWIKRGCDFDDNDEDKADRFTGDVDNLRDFENEKAALEDDLCDDPDAKFDVCNPATLAFADKDKDKDKDELTERDVDILCDASEDYEAHKEQCDKLYDNVEEDATLAFASSEEEEHCEDNGGDWKDKSCNFDDKDDAEEYGKEKYKHFADKPENQGRSDWEYDEEDAP